MNNKDAIKYLQKTLNENAHYNRITGRKLTDAYSKHFVIKYRLALLYAIKALRDADNTAVVLYLCDHKRCGENFNCYECNHTSDIRHAVNFDLIEFPRSIFVERTETDEGGGAHD